MINAEDLINWPDHVTLGEVRQYLREAAVKEGTRCPCCKKHVKVYQARIYWANAACILLMYRTHGKGKVDLSTLLTGHPMASSLRGKLPSLKHWGLVAEVINPDTLQPHSGQYRVTDAGAAFCEGETMMIEKKDLYLDTVIKAHGEHKYIKDFLGESFNFEELFAPLPELKASDLKGVI